MFFYLFQVQEKGLDAVEFDVRFTKDKVPILFHDARVDRVFTNGVGEVANMTLNEVQKLDFSLHYLRR